MNRTFVRRHGDRLRGPVACAAVAIIAAGGFAAPLAAPSFLSAAPATHYVASGESIQDAINAAEPGDTVEVAAGTYNENVIIDKELTLRSSDGADVTTIDGGSGSSQIAILVTGSPSEMTNVTNVSVEGFTVKTGESYASDERGIVLYYANDCLIRNNRAMNNWRGISLEGNTWENTISNNYMTGNMMGVSLQYTSGDAVRYNTVVEGQWGIYLNSASGTACHGNTIETDAIGTFIMSGSTNQIHRNIITGASQWGIAVGGGGSHYITGNTITGCGVGFYSEKVGQFVYYNNFLSNTTQVSLPNPYGSVYWDDSVGQGNYWSDYVTRYPDAVEVGETGAWDTPYVIFDDIYGNRDNYPLVNQWVAPPVTWTLSVDADGEGTVAIDGGALTLPYSEEYPEEDEVILIASAATGWEFVEWTGDATGTNPELALTMDDDISVTAVFSPQSINLTLAVGWNLISVPVTIGNNTVAEAFAEIDHGDIYTWIPAPAGGSYLKLDADDVIDPHRAYWISITSAPTEPVTLTGEPVSVDEWSASLFTGWNMVGTPWSENPIPLNDLGDGGSGTLQDDAIYWWDAENRTYELILPDGDITPGVGYWMACTADCTVTMAPPPPV